MKSSVEVIMKAKPSIVLLLPILLFTLFFLSITTYGDSSTDHDELVININIRNSVIGNPSEAEVFKFLLNKKNGDVLSEELQGEGTTCFSLSFKMSGTYTFTLYEEPGSTAGYDYDLSKHEVKFLIMQDLKGNFTYDVYVDGTKTDYPDISFTNYYNSPPPMLMYHFCGCITEESQKVPCM